MKILLFVLTSVPFISLSQNNAVLKLGTRDSVYSTVLGETRHYWIHLPSSYHDKSIQPIQYPVLYILDGNIHFHSITGMVDILSSGVNGTHTIPEIIVVAILNTHRTRDFTPTKTDKGVDGKPADYVRSGGGGDNFLKFIKDELIPRVEGNYRTFPYRIFIGHSFGGVAVIHALITMPQLFNAYVAIDPSLWWDNKVMLARFENYIATQDLKAKHLFIAQAHSIFADDPRPLTHLESIKEMASILQKSNSSGLKSHYKYYDQENHGSVAFISEFDALRFIFKDYHAPFDKIKNADELKKHYESYSDKIKVKFPPPEKVVNEFAGFPMYFQRYEVVREYYELNIGLYPESPGVYEKMAELYLLRGDKSKALDYFTKSLERNPQNQNVKNKIKNLSLATDQRR